MLLAAFFLLLILIFYMIYKAHYDIINYQTIVDNKLPTAFNGMSIFFIADIHRRLIKDATLNKISHPIDFVMIGGDLTEKGVPFERTRKNITKLKRWNVPIYFVMGNNDYEVLPGTFETLLQQEGVVVLKDDFTQIHKRTSSIYLYGFDYDPDHANHLFVNWDKESVAFRILLTHTPRSFEELPHEIQNKFNIVFAGHTHGGQIRLGPLGLYRNGGLSNVGDTNVLISEGYGYSLLPFRLQTTAECHVITLKEKE
ncbi:metallophosphoesterase [Virgibacillus sp. W0181]|uniref:metallophosphoesterase n=1 Tax=Virgibacillus sp. W0181 TaxID=3391581 RepID=UPI003F488D80